MGVRFGEGAFAHLKALFYANFGNLSWKVE